MVTVVAEKNLYRSCRILFGSDLKVSHEFLQYLQLSGIKKAYRRKVMEIHPDRGSCQDLILQRSMTHQFIDVHEAYKNLVSYLEVRDTGQGSKSSPVSFSVNKRGEKVERPGQTSAAERKRFYQEKANIHRTSNGRQQKPSEFGPLLDPKSLYRGPMPNCPLLFGRYLYYSGTINLQTIVQALIWQRSQRPRFGEIGRRLGWLNEQDTYRILQNRQGRQLFGELALGLGILTREQLSLILLHQKKLHRRIGQYFVVNNYWDGARLEEYIKAHTRHNSKVRNLSA